MYSYVLIFITSGLYVALRSFQQRNVVDDKWAWIFPTAMLMAVFDVFIISSVARNGYQWGMVIAIGSGGSIGCICGMLLHKHIFRGSHETQSKITAKEDEYGV